MSCGEPHETDCSEVLADVWLFLDHECDGARRRLLAHHLDECSPCLAEYGIDEKLKRLLAAKCGGEHAPSGLRDRLREHLRERAAAHAELAAQAAQAAQAAVTVVEQTEVTVESGPTGTTVELRATRVERSS